MAESCRNSDLVPIYKRKKDVQTLGNYRSVTVKALYKNDKIFEKMMYSSKAGKYPDGVYDGNRPIKAVFILRKMMKNYGMAGRKLYMAFVDLEKALIMFQIWWAQKREEVE